MSFKPDLKPYNTVGRFKFWCQKVLPTVYDNSLSYYEVLNKIVKYLNDLIENIDTMEDNVDAINEAFGLLEEDVYREISEFKTEVQQTLDSYVTQIEALEGRVDDAIEDMKHDVSQAIGVITTALQAFERRFEQLEEEVLSLNDNNAFTPTAFIPKWGVVDSWIMFNTGADESVSVPDIPSGNSSIAYVSATFDNSQGDHAPEVYFRVDDNTPMVETNDILYYAYVYSTTYEEFDIFFSPLWDTGVRIGVAHTHVNANRVAIIPITGTIISGSIVTGDRFRTLGIKFETLGAKDIKVAIIPYNVNKMFATLYNRMLMQEADSLEALRITVSRLQTLPTPPSTDGVWYLRYYKDGSNIYTSWVGPYPLDDEIKPEVTPTTDGRYVTVLTVENGENFYEWEEYSPRTGSVNYQPQPTASSSIEIRDIHT